MSDLFIGISGINAADNPGPGTGIARSIKEDRELNARLIGLAYDALEPGIYMDWLFENSFTLPYPSSGGDDFLGRLLEVQALHGVGPPQHPDVWGLVVDRQPHQCQTSVVQ